MKKFTHTFIKSYYAEYGYILDSVYKHSHTKDTLICPNSHTFEIALSSFKKGSRCRECFVEKIKSTHEYVFNYHKEHGYRLDSLYNNAHTKNDVFCPEGHKIKIRFNDFQQGIRCSECHGNKKLTQQFVKNYYEEQGYKLESEYVNNSTKSDLVCPKNHKIKMNFNNFKNGKRCRECHRLSISGENHPRFNPNREDLPLNLRLRCAHPKDWKIKYMIDDPKYNEFIKDPENYVVDHIIPVSLFCRLTNKYNLNEMEVQKIINKRENLQLLTHIENHKKFTNGSSLFEAAQFLINNGMKFEFFLDERESE